MLVSSLVPAALSLLVGQRNPFFCGGSLAKVFMLEAGMTRASFCPMKWRIGAFFYHFSAVSIRFAKKRRL